MRHRDSQIQELEGRIPILESSNLALKSQKAAADAENERLHDDFEARLANKEREIQTLLDCVFEPGWTADEVKSALQLHRPSPGQDARKSPAPDEFQPARWPATNTVITVRFRRDEIEPTDEAALSAQTEPMRAYTE
jgi:hypothetical protein